jgi:hypothetical protein
LGFYIKIFVAATLLYYRAEDEKGLAEQVVAIHVFGEDEVPFADEVNQREASNSSSCYFIENSMKSSYLSC